MDTWGPYNSITHDEFKYFLTIVDDFGKATWTHLLSTKSNAFPILKSFLSMVKRQFNSKVKVIRTDNAFELGNGHTDFFLSNGIIHQITCVYTPQQNGIVERKHKHLLETSRDLLYQYHLPISYWGECLLTATYLINRFPSSALNSKTPYEILFKTSPNYSYLKCFGCLCFFSTLTTHRTKFDLKDVRCVFIGYPYGKKGYKVLNLKTKKIYVSKDVIFHEEYFPYSSKSDPTLFPYITSLSTELPSEFPIISSELTPVKSTSCNIPTSCDPKMPSTPISSHS